MNSSNMLRLFLCLGAFALASSASLNPMGRRSLMRRERRNRKNATSLVNGLSAQQPTARVEDMTVGMVVPCVQTNIDNCELYRLLDSVAAQTEVPNQVVIVPSGMLAADGAKLENDLKDLYANTPLKDTTLKVTALENQVFAGASRNHGIAELNTHVVIAMDADDEMAPITVAMAKSVLRQTGAKCMLHTYAWPRDRELALSARDPEIWRNYTHANGTELYNNLSKHSGGTIKLEPGGLHWYNAEGRQAAQGHLTCQRDVFDKLHYNTSLEAGEDALLVRNILNYYGPDDASSLHVVDVNLSVYHPSHSPRNAYMFRWEKYNMGSYPDVVPGWIKASSLVAKPSEGSQNTRSPSIGCVRDAANVADSG